MESRSDQATEQEVPSDKVPEQHASFGLLLDSGRQLRVRDDFLHMFSAASTDLELIEARRHAAIALGRLQEAVQRASRDLGQNVQLMADACHGAGGVAKEGEEGGGEPSAKKRR